jgi:hypothetical protein
VARTAIRREISKSILAAPLLEHSGAAPSLDEARAVLALAIEVWNAHVTASPCWRRANPKPLAALRKSASAKQAAPELAERFETLSARCEKKFKLDPRLVGTGRSRRIISRCSSFVPRLRIQPVTGREARAKTRLTRRACAAIQTTNRGRRHVAPPAPARLLSPPAPAPRAPSLSPCAPARSPPPPPAHCEPGSGARCCRGSAGRRARGPSCTT